MSESRDERLLSFLEGELNEAAREALLDEVLADPDMARDLRRAAAGLGAMQDVHSGTSASGVTGEQGDIVPRRVSPWWALAAAAAAVLVSVPATWTVARQTGASAPELITEPVSRARPQSPDPSFVLVLQGRWPDLGQVAPGRGPDAPRTGVLGMDRFLCQSAAS